jgi:hypothetical protein
MNSAKNALINASAKRSKNNHEVAPKHGGIEADTGKSPAIHHSFKQQTSIDTASAAMKAASIGSNNSAATIRRTTLNKESSVVSMPPVNGVHQNGGIDLGKGVAALGSQIATDVQPSKTKQQQQHHQKISLIMGGNDPSKSSSTNINKYKTIHVVNSSGQQQQQSLTSIAKKLSLQQAPHTLQPIQSTTTTSSSSSSKNDIQAASKSQQYVVDTSGKNSNVNSGTGAESSTNNLPRKISFSKPDPEASGDANDNIKSNNSNREGVNVDEINEKLRLKRTATPRKRLPVADLPPE